MWLTVTNVPTPLRAFLPLWAVGSVVDVHRVDVVLRLVVLRFRFPILMLQFLLTGHNRARKRGTQGRDSYQS